jgi:hypothetical protein
VSRHESCHVTRSDRALDQARHAVCALCIGIVSPRGLASLAMGRARLGLFGSVAGPLQAEHALRMSAACLGFDPVPILK